MSSRTLAVLQPGYMPWLGFFDQLARSDVFVVYDDVQYDKHGWRNRNRIKSAQGALWLTVPVLHKGRFEQPILETEIDRRTPWARKHLASIRQCYARAPYLGRYLPELEETLTRDWRLLVDLDLAVISLMRSWLGIATGIVRSSELKVEGGKSERLATLCERFGAGRYLSGSAARDYLDIPLFRDRGIDVEFQDYGHPTYPQLHGAFIPFLSTLDLILNRGPESLEILRTRPGAAKVDSSECPKEPVSPQL